MRTFGLIGYPLSHSFSKDYFNRKFCFENLDADYLNYPITSIADFPRLLAQHPYIAGLNVTLPYKQQIIPFLNKLSSEAEKIGAVNVVKIIRNANGDTILEGYNSDAAGFSNSLNPLLQPGHNKALILGTGGASKAVAYALSQMGIEYRFVSRNPDSTMFGYTSLTPKVMNEYKLIVNTTPVGMYPETGAAPDIPYALITTSHLVFDLIYNPETTLFLHNASSHGATVKNGKEMLILQAEEAWRIWNSYSTV